MLMSLAKNTLLCLLAKIIGIEEIAKNIVEKDKSLEAKITAAEELVKGDCEAGAKDAPFYSVFNLVSLPSTAKKTKEVTYFQPTCELSIENYQFLTEYNKPKEQESKEQKKYIANGFDGVAQLEQALKNIDMNDIHVDTLLSLCKRYLWCVPASAYFEQESDISCFEHIRLIVALVDCEDTENYLLVCGDITGIQSYIYGIGHKGAAKALKGRSFWLNQCVDMSAYHILEACGLSTANLIYSSGGKFYLLLSKNHTKVLEKAQGELEDYFYEEYDGDLAIVIAQTSLKTEDFIKNNISDKWEAVNDGLEIKKRQKYSSKFKTGFFKPFGYEGSVVQCAHTKKDLCKITQLTPRGKNTDKYWVHNIPRPGKVDAKIYEPNGEPDGIISKEQYLSIEIGAKLKATGNKTLTIFGKNEKEFEFLSKSIDIDKDALTSPKLKQHIYFNDFFNPQNSIANKPTTQKFYGGNWQGFDNYEDLICKSVGIDRLGVLRMDVDNLGKVFQDGLGTKATFGRVVQMSSMLDFFFCGYLNKLQKLRWSVDKGINADEGNIFLHDSMQIIYAGGDDVFIIGVWNILPDIAAWISEKFALFTGGNTSLTISAGISLFENKYPIYKAAQEAGEAEHKAKGKRKTKDGKEAEKNAICFLGVTVSFADFEIVRKYMSVLYKAVKAKTLSKSIISRLYQFYADYQGSPDSEGKYTPKLWSKWRWQAAYSLSRYAKQHQAADAEINELKRLLFTSEGCEQDFIILSYLIAQWADLLTREKKKN
jgi:CRISPR-associated protein Csm1